MTTRRAPLSGHRLGLRAALGLVLLALATAVVWSLTHSGPVSMAVLAGGLALLASVKTRHRHARIKRERAQELILAVDLDHHVLALPLPDEWPVGAQPAITRQPLPSGRASYFINRVDLVVDGFPPIPVVEKAVKPGSGELSFWEGSLGTTMTTEGDLYSVVEPIAVGHGEVVSVIYFPYHLELERTRRAGRREFRSELRTIVAAIAEFNGRNAGVGGTAEVGPWSTPARPTRKLIGQHLGVSNREALQMLHSWEVAYDDWVRVDAVCRSLPVTLNHNDISPQNVASTGSLVLLSDFGLAGLGPVGSDLHTPIKWLASMKADRDDIDGLFPAYLEAIKPYLPAVTVDEVQAAAWSSFFARYTNLRLRSARSLYSFTMALDGITATRKAIVG